MFPIEAINSFAPANMDLISKYQKDFDEFNAAKK